MRSDIFSHAGLVDRDVALLEKLIGDLPILADIQRSDLLLLCRSGAKALRIVAQARPHSVAALYEADLVGRRPALQEQREMLRVLSGGGAPRQVRTITVRGTAVARQVYAVRNRAGQPVAVLAKDAYWLAHERQRRRSQVFQRAALQFTHMVLRGDIRGAEGLSPFGERDGVLYVGTDRIIHYVSGIAASLYSKLGYRSSLVGRGVHELATVDGEFTARALNTAACVERRDEQDGFTWLRRALPVAAPNASWNWLMEREVLPGWTHRARTQLRGVLVLVHDETEALQKQRELDSKMSLLREVHHRVKNNLQVIASIMRMQARRAKTDEARELLEESVSRILSVAVVHEFLSQNAQGVINLQEVAHRILQQLQRGLVDPTKRISLKLAGAAIWLPAGRATQCALLINELVQNAIEHGMADRIEGRIDVSLVDGGDEVTIVVADDGQGLPEGFDLGTNANLGLTIVNNVVERDLRGQFSLRSAKGTIATVRFNKSMLGGD